MSHRILDNKTDSKCIESFISATNIDLNTITIGTQVYYLYKEEDNNSILSWYWGCIIEINKNRPNGEYYHIWHDDEDPWVDLSIDKNDWKQIPKTHELYDNQFDIKDYLIMNNKNNTIANSTKNKKKSPKTKKIKRKKFKSNNNNNYEISTRGHVSMYNNQSLSCTIIQGIQLYSAVKLQRVDANNPYILWVRKEDIKKVLTNHKLFGQRISYEFAGQTNRYKIIEINKDKKFIQVFWNKNVNNTWIHINNFNPIKTRINSNKENQQQNVHININDGHNHTSKKKKHKNKNKNKNKKRKSNKSNKSKQQSLICTSNRISDIERYQKLPRLYNNNNNNNNNNYNRNSNSNNNSNNSTPQRQFLNNCNNSNVFTSPIYNSNNNNNSHKRQRDNDIFTNGTLPNKRQRLNNGINNNISTQLRLIAMQPPQPQHLQMPPLQQDLSPKNTATPKPIPLSHPLSHPLINININKMPSPDDCNPLLNSAINTAINSFADDVSSESSQSSINPSINNSNSNSNISDKMEEDIDIKITSDTDTESQDTEDIDRDRCNNIRHVLSEPPPYKYRHNNNNGHGNGHGMISPICLPLLPMVSVERITDKIMDKTISNTERIHSLKCIVKYLTNCQNTMNEMWGRFGLQCKNVIKCVEAIIKDLEQRC